MYTPPTYALHLHGGYMQRHAFHLDPPKNVLLLHWEKMPKTCLLGFPPNKCSKFLLLSLKSFVAEKRYGLCKIYSYKKKKERKRIEKKWTSVRIIKTMGTQMPT